MRSSPPLCPWHKINYGWYIPTSSFSYILHLAINRCSVNAYWINEWFFFIAGCVLLVSISSVTGLISSALSIVSVYLSICLSVSIYLSINQSLSIYHHHLSSIYHLLSFYLSLYYLSLYLSIHHLSALIWYLNSISNSLTSCWPFPVLSHGCWILHTSDVQRISITMKIWDH